MRPTVRTGLLALLFAMGAVAPVAAATLAPSADPVTGFIVAADSVSRSGDDALATFVRDNHSLVGAAVASLLDIAFQVTADNPAAAKENVDFARRVASIHEANGGSNAARLLVDAYDAWTPAQRRTRERAMDLEAQAVDARKAGEIDRAVSLLAQARALYEKIGDRHAVAVNWGTSGLTRWSTGDWTAIAADYEKALAERRAVDDRILQGRTLNGLGSVNQNVGDSEKAIDYYRQAIDIRRETGDLPGVGTSLTYLGHVYNTTGRYVQARAYYEEALPMLEALGNPQQMVELLTGIALLNAEMNRSSDANQAYIRGIELASANGLGPLEALCRRNLANNYRDQGRFNEALDEVGRALALLEANPSPSEQTLAYLTRGLTFMNMGEFDDARVDLLRCSELAQSLDNPEYAILAQLNISHLYRELHAFDRALKAADQAKQLAEQAANGRHYREAMALRGSILAQTGAFDAALEAWQEALAQDEYDKAEQHVLVDHVGIASVYAVMGRNAEARQRIRETLPGARAAGHSEVVWACLLAMGHSFEKENADSAAFYYEKALAEVEAGGADIGGAEIQTGYHSGKRGFYYEEVTRFYAQTAATTGDATWSARAFHTNERAKARGLLDLLRARAGERTSAEEAGILDALYSLDTKQADYADRRAVLERQYVDLRDARVRSEMGTLGKAATIVDLDALARELPKQAVFLEYALGDSASFLWVVGRDSRRLVELPARPVIEAEVRRMRDALARVDGGESALLASARKLYTTLLGPAQSHIEKASTAIIVPAGILFELPFEALLTAEPVAGAAWRDQPFLARKVATLYAPSATVYASLKGRGGDRKYALELLAVGNPDFSTLAPRGNTPLAPLPFADAEVAAIGVRLKDEKKRIVTGADASEATLKRELRNGAPRVVHLATHGLVDPSDPSRSSVALAAGAGEDGYLHTLEILGTPIRSGVVVMSACESARGKVSRGEGVVGLSRAFLAAGAETVVASLWAVSDESTAELMKAFYEQMFGKKRSASRSLNEARLALIEGGKFSHPFYWSPFTVTGTERSPW